MTERAAAGREGGVSFFTHRMKSSAAEPLEIERKFLLRSEAWREAVREPGRRLTQGYLCSDALKSVRVRVVGEDATITVKGSRQGITRLELQYSIPVPDALRMLELCAPPLIDKTRHIAWHDGMKWEVDVFHGENEGLVMAEVELESEDQPVNLPEWAGEEVSLDARYYNSCLARQPFSTWPHVENQILSTSTLGLD